jgi:prophage regulatory protein
MKILRYRELLARLGLRSAASLYEHADSGVLTRPIKIGPKAAGWPEHEIDVILEARAIGATNDEIREIVKGLHAKRDAALTQLRANLGKAGVAA